jgi:hypothetical protein
MILQNDSFSIAQTLSDLPALLTIQHDTAKVRVYGVVFVEAQAVLCHHVQLAAKDGECFAVGTVACVRMSNGGSDGKHVNFTCEHGTQRGRPVSPCGSQSGWRKPLR